MSETITVKKRTRSPSTPVAPPAPVAVPIPIAEWAESPPAIHSVVQGHAGPARGILAQIGEINGKTYRCYIIRLNARPEEIEIRAADCVVIGPGKVAPRNPFPPPPQQQPELPPEQDPSHTAFEG